MKDNRTSVKRSLFVSAIALTLTAALLIGTTFAWFTSTASTGVSSVEAGKLKVTLLKGDQELSNADVLTWQKAEGQTATALWEPGCTYNLEPLTIKNTGSLALKYKIVITGIKGDAELNNVIDWTVNDTALDADHPLAVGASDTLAISGHMQETAGDTYQGKTIDGISITVVATQDTVEYDSTTKTYDKFATYPDVEVKKVTAGDSATVSAEVKDVIASATKPTQIVLPENAEVIIDSSVGSGKDIKFTGSKDSVVKFQTANGALSYQDNANLTFEGITVTADGTKGLCARGGSATFTDCTITGELKQTIGGTFSFKGCVFEQTDDQYAISQLGYGSSDVIIEDCTFNVNGKAIKIYSEGSTPVNLTVKNCTFNNTNTNGDKSAIFIDHIIDGISYNITVDGCEFNGFTNLPTRSNNQWAARKLMFSYKDSTTDEYIFAYQTGEESGSYYKPLDTTHLSVKVDGTEIFTGDN